MSPNPAKPNAQGSVIGHLVEDSNRPVTIPLKSFLLSLLILGVPGTGKSSIISNLLAQDIKNGRGVCLIDPHGDLTDDVLPLIRKAGREQDVIYFDMLDDSYFFGLNPLFCEDPTNEAKVQYTLEQVRHIFAKTHDITEKNHLMYNYLTNCLYVLIINGCTLVDIRPLLTDEAYREKLLKKVKKADVSEFWEDYNRMGKEDPRRQREERRTILNKLDDFSSFPLRYILGQRKTTLNLREIMDQGKILLVRLDLRLERATDLLGSILVAQILNAGYSRQGQKKRRQFHLYVDEFQHFATKDFSVLISDARKFGIGCILATQNLTKLDKDNKASLRGCGLVLFRVSDEDADELKKSFKSNTQKRKTQKKQIFEKQVEREVSYEWLSQLAKEQIEKHLEEISVLNDVGSIIAGKDAILRSFVPTSVQFCVLDLISPPHPPLRSGEEESQKYQFYKTFQVPYTSRSVPLSASFEDLISDLQQEKTRLDLSADNRDDPCFSPCPLQRVYPAREELSYAPVPNEQFYTQKAFYSVAETDMLTYLHKFWDSKKDYPEYLAVHPLYYKELEPYYLRTARTILDILNQYRKGIACSYIPRKYSVEDITQQYDAFCKRIKEKKQKYENMKVLLPWVFYAPPASYFLIQYIHFLVSSFPWGFLVTFIALFHLGLLAGCLGSIGIGPAFLDSRFGDIVVNLFRLHEIVAEKMRPDLPSPNVPSYTSVFPTNGYTDTWDEHIPEIKQMRLVNEQQQKEIEQAGLKPAHHMAFRNMTGTWRIQPYPKLWEFYVSETKALYKLSYEIDSRISYMQEENLRLSSMYNLKIVRQASS